MRSEDQIKADIAELQRVRAKRVDKPGFSANVAEIDARLAALNAELEAANG